MQTDTQKALAEQILAQVTQYGKTSNSELFEAGRKLGLKFKEISEVRVENFPYLIRGNGTPKTVTLKVVKAPKAPKAAKVAKVKKVASKEKLPKHTPQIPMDSAAKADRLELIANIARRNNAIDSVVSEFSK